MYEHITPLKLINIPKTLNIKKKSIFIIKTEIIKYNDK